jgi:RNA polymerase primary sigma factor
VAAPEARLKARAERSQQPPARKVAAAPVSKSTVDRHVEPTVIAHMVESVDGYIHQTVQRHIFRTHVGAALDYEDLLSVGRMGAMKAARRFDPSRGFKFLTYASNWIQAYIRREIQDVARIIRVPVHALEKRGVLDDESHKAVNLRQRIAGTVTSLDAPLTEDGLTLAELLPSDGASPSTTAERMQLYKEVIGELENFKNFDPRTKDILLRYATGEVTLEQLGDEHGLSRERVRQIFKLARERLQAIFQRRWVREVDEGTE